MALSWQGQLWAHPAPGPAAGPGMSPGEWSLLWWDRSTAGPAVGQGTVLVSPGCSLHSAGGKQPCWVWWGTDRVAWVPCPAGSLPQSLGNPAGISLPAADRVELHHPQGPFHPKPSCDSSSASGDHLKNNFPESHLGRRLLQLLADGCLCHCSLPEALFCVYKHIGMCLLCDCSGCAPRPWNGPGISLACH